MIIILLFIIVVILIIRVFVEEDIQTKEHIKWLNKLYEMEDDNNA